MIRQFHSIKVNYPVLMAGALMATISVIVVFIVLQRRVIEGIAITGTKG